MAEPKKNWWEKDNWWEGLLTGIPAVNSFVQDQKYNASQGYNMFGSLANTNTTPLTARTKAIMETPEYAAQDQRRRMGGPSNIPSLAGTSSNGISQADEDILSELIRRQSELELRSQEADVLSREAALGFDDINDAEEELKRLGKGYMIRRSGNKYKVIEDPYYNPPRPDPQQWSPRDQFDNPNTPEWERDPNFSKTYDSSKAQNPYDNPATPEVEGFFNQYTGQWSPPQGYIDPFQKAQLAQQDAQLAYQQQRDQQQADMQQKNYLAQLQANPASWLEYAAASGQQAAIQPWMVPLMQGTNQGAQAGQALPGNEGGNLENLPELGRPSMQYVNRMAPSARQQYAGYQKATTGATADDTAFWLQSSGPPGGGFSGARRLRY